ncbi:IS1 family transposase, partial [Aeromonas veronii]|uniref:IS1 family transposase n=1 Tax=Aeromonas veronii TaxID=654 RepID=UPI003D1A1C0A
THDEPCSMAPDDKHDLISGTCSHLRYAREVPSEMHLTGKIFTQRIERNNLTLRMRIKRLARKTICFSRSVELHEKVIGAFIERHHFN